MHPDFGGSLFDNMQECDSYETWSMNLTVLCNQVLELVCFTICKSVFLEGFEMWM